MANTRYRRKYNVFRSKPLLNLLLNWVFTIQNFRWYSTHFTLSSACLINIRTIYHQRLSNSIKRRNTLQIKLYSPWNIVPFHIYINNCVCAYMQTKNIHNFNSILKWKHFRICKCNENIFIYLIWNESRRRYKYRFCL